MKYFLTMAIAVFLMAGQASAQHVNIGIKGGLNLYNINNDNNSTNDPIVGYNLGLLGHIHLVQQLALQPEIVFSTQGAKNTLANVDTRFNLAYVNIPILLQYMFDNGFRIQAGPQFGILTSAKSKINKNSSDIKSDMEKVAVGLSAGMSYVNPSTGFGVDARYNYGLSNINKSDVVKSTNRGIQLGLFYLFGHH